MRIFIMLVCTLLGLAGVVLSFIFTMNTGSDLAIIWGLVWAAVMLITFLIYDTIRISKYPIQTDFATIISKWYEEKSTYDGTNYGTETSYFITYEFSDGRHFTFSFARTDYDAFEEGDKGVITYREDKEAGQLVFVDFSIKT